MAIPFLNNINLSDNELQNAKLHVTSTAPTAAAAQIYFDSTLSDLTAKYYSNSTDLWVSLKEYSFTAGTYVEPTVTGTTPKPIITFDLNAVDGTAAEGERYLTKNNTWAEVSSIPGTYTFEVAADSGAPETILDGDTLSIIGNTYITTVVGATDTVTINHDATSRTDTTSSDSPGYGGTFEAVTSVTTNATGHVTAVDVSTVTIPASDNTTYDLEGVGSTNGTAGVRLTETGTSNHDDVLIVGAGTTTVTRSVNTLTVTSNDQFTGTVTSVTEGPGITVTPSATSPTVAVDYLGSDNYLLEAGAATVASSEDIINFSDDSDSNVKKTTLGTIPVDSLTLVKNYIDSSVSGGVYYQGGYDPTTDLTSPGNYGLQTPPNPNIIEIGWMYTVTADGTFFGEQVRVGDVLIAEIDAPTSLSDWTTVQNNIDLATSLVVGLGNVVPGSSNTITAPYSNGTATLDVVDSAPTQKGAVIVDAGTGISVSYNNGTATVTNTQTNSNNTYAVTISDTATITHGLSTKDIIVQLYDVVTNETVYADIVRVNTSPFNTATITFSATPTNDVRVLVQKIG
jgi:hypothetical protein